ncbi:MAG: MscS Mechanosensitive ion channel [Solirubrobacterales bacterium]|nr:MscS Mechanosensitive ion channel [Solirubrobacterales bacterium]
MPADPHAVRRTGRTRALALRAHFGPEVARRARRQALVVLPLITAILVLYRHRGQLFGAEWDTTVRTLAAIALVALGWQLARDAGQALGPELMRHLDPPTAGTVGFLIRLFTMITMLTLALRVAGLSPQTLALGGALTAVVVGLAGQQTIGNLIAGTVLLSAQPFRVGDRIRLQGGGLAGSIEGVVRSLGLLYTTLAEGGNLVMVPNAVVTNVAVVPLREPPGVDLQARLRPGVTPAEVEQLLKERVSTPIRGRPSVKLEELDADHIGVRITATPFHPADGPHLASEVIEAIAGYAISPPQLQEERRDGSMASREEGGERVSGAPDLP